MIFAKALTPAQVYALYKSESGNMIDHDAAGNLIADKDGYLYDYDGENRIVRISRGDGDSTPTTVAEFVYDALGRRIYAYDAIADTGRYFCYNNAWQVLEEYDDAGDFAWANIFGNYIDEVLVRAGNDDVYYYAHNHLYSPVAVMDFDAGTVLERYDYDAYGTTHMMDAGYNVCTASAVGNPYTFTGRELDTLDGGNLKTMHYRHRSYDPLTGRFTQSDPLEFIDSLNLYEYVLSNPVFYIDPWGLASSLENPEGIAVIEEIIPGTAEGIGEAIKTAPTVKRVIKLRYIVTAIIAWIVDDKAKHPRPNETLPGPGQGGPPNGDLTEDRGKYGKTIRHYGPDGQPIYDIDYGHNHENPNYPNGPGDPHIHHWGPNGRDPYGEPIPVVIPKECK